MNVKSITVSFALATFLLLDHANLAIAKTKIQSCENLTADWPLWSSLSKHPWTQQDIRDRLYFPLDQVLKALQAVPLSAPLPLNVATDTENYEQSRHKQSGHSDYLIAATAYRAGDLAKAIPLFDAIVANTKSHFRAAAAYSAARATIRLGHLDDAAHRINTLVHDPTLREFHYQAYDLLSKMRYNYEAASLNAAELAEATHMLAAPTAAICGDPIGEKLRQKFGDEIGELIISWPKATSVRKIATTAMSPLDPLISVADAVSHSRYMRHSRFSGGEYTWEDDKSDIKVPASFRIDWEATHNPLWAVSLLENSNDEADLAVVPQAITTLHQWPKLSKAGAARYVWRLIAQAVRIELMHGNLDRAASFSSLLSKEDMYQARKHVLQPDIASTGDIIMTGGIRWFIHKYDYTSARRWAFLAHHFYDLSIPSETKPVLARDFTELYGDQEFSLDKKGGKVELGDARVVLDLLPGAALIKLSQLPQVASDDRKAMVGAAWSRAYALQHWNDIFAWLSDMKAAFPELKEEVQEIENARTQEEKQHLATHLLAGAPGLIALPSWSRPPGGIPNRSLIDLARPNDIHSFDTENRNDGNWWCEPNPKEIETDAINRIMAIAAGWNPIHEHFTGVPDQQSSAKGDMQKVIDAFPILKEIDLRELQSLENIGSASKRLASDADEWAIGSRNENREYLPKTLLHSLRGTRYACQKGMDNGPWSHKVFLDLHRLYPNSKEAKQARYWFGHRIQPTPEIADVAAQGKPVGLYIKLPKGLTKCLDRNELFLSPPASCDSLDAEAGVARHQALPLHSFAINVFSARNDLQNNKPILSDGDLVSVFCNELPEKQLDTFTFFGVPAKVCSKKNKDGIELKVMSLFFSPAEVPGNASPEEEDAKNTVVIIDLKTTPQDLEKDAAIVKKITGSASLCVPRYVQSSEDSLAHAEKRASRDLAKELAIPACPPSMDWQ